MNILVTGSAGFIGSNLMKALQKEGKHKILGVDKKYGVNISRMENFFEVVNKLLGKADLIVHLAAQTSTKRSVQIPSFDFYDNVAGTFNVCEMARAYGADVIYTSTRKILHAPYGVSKYCGELYLKEYEKTFGIKTLITRLGNVYGPGQQGSQEAFWLAWFIKASMEMQPITIYGWNGEQSRDMLYIDDCISLLMDQINNFQKYRACAKGELLEAGGGKENEISLLETLKVLNYTNYNFGSALPGDVKREITDNTFISSINNWKPKVSIQTGIQKTIDHIRDITKKGGENYAQV